LKAENEKQTEKFYSNGHLSHPLFLLVLLWQKMEMAENERESEMINFYAKRREREKFPFRLL
jgi:hypothetical protein